MNMNDTKVNKSHSSMVMIIEQSQSEKAIIKGFVSNIKEKHQYTSIHMTRL